MQVIYNSRKNALTAVSGPERCWQNSFWNVFSGAEIEVVTNIAISDDIAWRFKGLHLRWLEERKHASFDVDITSFESYQKIIGIGPNALPLIFRQLRLEGDHPDHWFSALSAITNEDPIDPKDWGNLNNMAKAWLNWANVNGYIYF